MKTLDFEYHLPQKCWSLFKYGHAATSNGTGLNGCYASHIILRRGTHIVKVPDTLPDAAVAPANCALATVINAVSRLPESCRTVVVQGAGLLGLYACALLRERGVEHVLCIDIQQQRLEQIQLFGGIAVDGRRHESPLKIGVSGLADAKDRIRENLKTDGNTIKRTGGVGRIMTPMMPSRSVGTKTLAGG